MKTVLDASVVIDYLRKKQGGIGASLLVDGSLSLMTVAELYSGKSAQASGEQLRMLGEILSRCEVVIPDLEVAKEVGKLRSQYQLSLGDAFVTQLALATGLPLATLDKKAFSRIPGLKFYSVETKRK